MLYAMDKADVEQTPGYTLIFIKNNIDSQTYCKIYFEIPPALKKNSKGVEKLIPALLKNHSSELKNHDITLFTDENQISALSSLGIDTVFKYMSQLVLTHKINDENFNEKKNAVIKSSFPPDISPNEYISNKTQNAFYLNNHPLGEEYNLKEMRALSFKDCQNYYNNYYLKSSKFIVIIGNDNFEEIKISAAKYFAEFLPPDIETQKFKTPSLPEHSIIYFHETESKITEHSTYLNLLYPIAIAPGDKDFFAFEILSHVLGKYKTGKLSTALTTENDFAEFVFFSRQYLPTNSQLAISAIFKPHKLADVINTITQQKQKLISENLSDTELKFYKDSYIMEFVKSLRSFEFISSEIISATKNKYPKNYYSSYISKIKSLTPDDIRQAAKKYLRYDKYTIVVLGKSPELENQLLKMAISSESRTFIEGRQSDLIPFGFNAYDIIRMFLMKVNAEKYPTTHGQEIKLKGNYFGEESQYGIERKVLRSGKNYLSETYIVVDSTKRVFLKKDLIKGKKIFTLNYNDTTQLSHSESRKLYTESFQFPELEYFLNDSIKLELLGVVKSNDSSFYKIQVLYPDGRAKFDYYDKASKLKMKSEEIEFKNDTFSIIRTINIVSYKQIPGTNKKLLPDKKIIIAPNYKIELFIHQADLNKRKINKQFDENQKKNK